MKQTIFERITQNIVDAIAEGADSYQMPWNNAGSSLGVPSNVATGRSYRGINILGLWASAQRANFASGIWGTYRQWESLGAQVKRGERGTAILFWSKRQDRDDDGNAEEERRRLGYVAKQFCVFNADQVAGYTPPEMPSLPETERCAAADSFFQNVGATIIHGGDQAYYAPSFDRIHMPDFSQFRSANAYYAVLAHELTHWTGAENRLNRNLASRFGSHDYAMEELIALSGQSAPCLTHH